MTSQKVCSVLQVGFCSFKDPEEVRITPPSLDVTTRPGEPKRPKDQTVIFTISLKKGRDHPFLHDRQDRVPSQLFGSRDRVDSVAQKKLGRRGFGNPVVRGTTDMSVTYKERYKREGFVYLFTES